MARIRWRAVVQCSAGSLALELLTFVCLRRLDIATAVCISLIIVVLSLRASLLVWAVGSFIVVGRLAFFFTPQISLFPGKRSERGRCHPRFLDDSSSADQSRGQ
jgi:hypothetical protein